MIRIHRPDTIPTTLTNQGRRLRDADVTQHSEGTCTFAFDREVYGCAEVKGALRLAQHDKCGFCESKVSHVAYGDVEHFRPKAGYRAAVGAPLTSPGYFWLAYEWSNLLFACELCNRRHKASFFPLVDETARARAPHDDVARETPLFLDPTAEDPSLHVGFREEYPYAVQDSPRGTETIRALGLDRADLVERRRDRLSKLRLLQRAVVALRRQRNAEAKKLSLAIEAEILHSVTDSAEFAAMARQISPPATSRSRARPSRTQRPRSRGTAKHG